MTDPQQRGSAAAHPGPELGPIGRLARWTFRHRARTMLIWLGAFLVSLGMYLTLAGSFSADYSAPGSDSQQAQQVLKEHFTPISGATIDVVAHAKAGITATATETRVDHLLDAFAASTHVKSVSRPWSTFGAISPDGTTARATIFLDVPSYDDMPIADTSKLIKRADSAGGRGLTVSVGGLAVQTAERGAISQEGIGLTAAAIILLFTLGTVVAAGLPLGVALTGLAISSLLPIVVAAALPVPSWSTSLATMMGLGVGIDYALLLVTRFREWRAVGLSYEDATVATMDTAGRSVLLAGSTVIVSMLGLFGMGLSFMRGAGLVTIISVAITLAAAMTFFPALLGYFGHRIERLRLPMPRRTPQVAESRHGKTKLSGWWRWSHLVQKHRVVAAGLATVVLLLLAAPFLSANFGFPDTADDKIGSDSRTAHDVAAAAFGPGAAGPLLIAAYLPDQGPQAATNMLLTALRSTPGIVGVTPATMDADRTAVIITAQPSENPQSSGTQDLVRHLRNDVLPVLSARTGLVVHVGGASAMAIDSNANIARRIPLLIGGVVGLSMLLLLVAFRSIAVAIKAAVMNLLSVGAAFGVVALVLQGGWAGHLVNVHHRTPLPVFVPVLMFAVLFGLSMDYEVFLVSRMRDSWNESRDNTTAIVTGLASTARVITAAAAIMIAVFASFIPSQDLTLKLLGIGMSSAILIDATVVRMLLVPAVMHLLGNANWWLPAWLDERMPQVHVEGHPERFTGLAVPAAAPAVEVPAQRSADEPLTADPVLPRIPAQGHAPAQDLIPAQEQRTDQVFPSVSR
jgi:RND superfamily putative drug exporter